VQLSFATAWSDAGSFVLPGRGPVPAPRVVAQNADDSPRLDPFVQVHIMADQPVTEGIKITRMQGFFQVDLLDKAGEGTALTAKMRDRVRQVWNGLEVSGLKTYATGGAVELPSHPPGLYGVHVDTNFNWIDQSP
jgi:hypothetical protein